MPLYEYYCAGCEDTFEVLRPMAQVNAKAVCPEGHPGARKVISVFATVGVAEEGGIDPSAFQGAGPCCGMGGCGCN